MRFARLRELTALLSAAGFGTRPPHLTPCAHEALTVGTGYLTADDLEKVGSGCLRRRWRDVMACCAPSLRRAGGAGDGEAPLACAVSGALRSD
jgi:hypothetical protein